MERRAEKADMKVVRVILAGGKGIRPVRQHDAVLDEDKRCVGWVLSAAAAGDNQIAIAYVDKAIQEGGSLGVYYAARSKAQIEKGRMAALEKGAQAEPDISAEVISRFERF
jgi:glycine cleavage system aminomethyltransferase T